MSDTPERAERRARAAPARPATAREPAPVERFTSPPATRAVELTPERAAQVVRQSSNARWVGFLAVVVVILFITIYWFYELGAARHQRAAARRRGGCPAGHRGRARLQPLRGQLRALPRRERRGRDRSGAQPPGQAVRPPQRVTTSQHDDRRRPVRLRQSEFADARLVQQGQPARAAQLRPDRGPDRVHPGPEQRDVHDPRPRAREPKHDPITGEVKTFKGWVDLNYKPAPARHPTRTAGRTSSPARRRAPSGSRARLEPSAPASGRDASVSIVAASRASRSRRPTSRRPADAAFVSRSTTRTPATPHNVAIKDSAGAVMFKGDIFPGVATRDYQVPALAAGAYPFVCTVHPNMTGTLTVE